jgi:hypothetical protein
MYLPLCHVQDITLKNYKTAVLNKSVCFFSPISMQREVHCKVKTQMKIAVFFYLSEYSSCNRIALEKILM